MRKKKSKSKLPPGQRLLLFLLLSAGCCATTIWFFQPHPHGIQQSVAADQGSLTGAGSANALTTPAVQQADMPFELRQEMTDLANQLKSVCDKPNLHAGVFVVDPDTGRYVDLDGRRAYSAASMIKLPVLVKMLQAIDKGQCSFDQEMTIRQDLIGGGSGWLQWRKPGSKLSLKDTAELMMIISDNTATNMIIDLLGGKEKCNADFASWGLTQTRINNALPDLPGTNTTSPYDLSYLLAKVDSGQLLTPASRAWLFSTLERNKIRSLLPQGIPSTCRIADKTGDIGSLVGDAGVITAASGKRYICTVSVERPYNDRRANAMIRQISNVVYAGVTGDTDGAKSAPCLREPAPRAVARHHVRRKRR